MLRKYLQRFSQVKDIKSIFKHSFDSLQTSKHPIELNHFINQKWIPVSQYSQSMMDIPCPLTSKPIFTHPKNVSPSINPLIRESMSKCKKSGMHNPFKNPERYRKWGETMTRVVEYLHQPEVHEHFASLI